MNTGTIKAAAGLFIGCMLGMLSNAWAQETTEPVSQAKHKQRLAADTQLKNHSFSDFGQEYIDFKNQMSEELGLQWGFDVSYLIQRGAPNGKQTSVQGIYYPYANWTLFKDRAAGSGEINFSYNLSHYWGTSGATLQERLNVASAQNDYTSNQKIFFELSYTHTLPDEWNWLSFTAGQFPISNFDGTSFLDNQQTALMNYSLSQNATSAYPVASLGAYVQAQNDLFTAAAGYQDATNVSGQTAHLSSAFDGKYTAFVSLAWTPSFEIGSGQYSFLYYYQPSVSAQPENVNGWSFNAQQNFGGHWAVFGRANGSTGGVTGIKNSYAIGAAWLNPFDRNPQDALTVGVAYNRLSEKGLGYPFEMRGSETALEFQWVIGIGKFVTVTPDLQFYPQAALNPNQGVTTVFGLRTTVML
ncbi:MAG: carbohydrate porin [Candidatus Avelusimicrobium sp.]|uniref:carbohydrate porin n=1 Tax=Candidatus Avelusimicrobium sp. TaxID=3048833 RepID=UPI003F120E79